MLEAKAIEHTRVNIADPREDEMRKFMTVNTPADDGQKVLPPQIFCDDEHVAVSARCGDVSVRTCHEAVAALLHDVVVFVFVFDFISW